MQLNNNGNLMDFIKSLINLQALNVQRGCLNFPKLQEKYLSLKNS